ncbi:hypothetical protein [Catenulispora subtropica]|uniref:Lipoprotein n=1 Tax=Catenulispora subtropica TaxID=450798 RepID=A0ABP5D3W0_9ACTN
MRYQRVVSGFAVAAAFVLTGTACSSGGTAGAGTAPADPAAAGARAQGLTALAKMTAPQAVAQTTKAVTARQSVKMHMVVTMPSLTETADGAMNYGGDVKADVTMTMSSTDPKAGALFAKMGTMEMRIIGSVGYVDMGKDPEFADAFHGKPWVKVDFGQVDKVPALKSFSYLKDMTKNQDPGAQLDALLASPDLKLVGTEQRAGVQALHYSGVVSPDDVLSATKAGSGLTQQDLDSAKALMQQSGATKADFDLWIGGDGLPVAITFSEDTKAGKVSGDVSYSDWGAPVAPTAPPADQTADLVQILGGH